MVNEQLIREELQALAKKYQIEVVEVNAGHFHIRGHLLVNYYPFSKRRTAYVGGSNASKSNCNPPDAVKMSLQAPAMVPKPLQDKRRASYAKIKRRMLAKSDKCHWCGCPLTEETATLDHVIPLARGGLDHPTNWVLACQPCNSERGCAMPELSVQALAAVDHLRERQASLEADTLILLSEHEQLLLEAQESIEKGYVGRAHKILAKKKMSQYQSKKLELKRLNMQLSSIEGKLYQALFSEVAKQKLPEQLFAEIQSECASRYAKIMLPYKSKDQTSEVYAGSKCNQLQGEVADEHQDAAGSGCPGFDGAVGEGAPDRGNEEYADG